MVDPGGELDRITEATAKLGVKIEKILLTHGHIDHAGGAADLASSLGVKVIGPGIADKPVLESIPSLAATFNMAGAKSVVPDQWLNEGDEIEVGGLHFLVIEAPGHSPGSVVFFHEKARFALMGDVLFQNSIGRTDIPGGDHEQLLRSIRDKILPLGDDVQFLPGHGNPGFIGHERANNPFLK